MNPRRIPGSRTICFMTFRHSREEKRSILSVSNRFELWFCLLLWRWQTKCFHSFLTYSFQNLRLENWNNSPSEKWVKWKMKLKVFLPKQKVGDNDDGRSVSQWDQGTRAKENKEPEEKKRTMKMNYYTLTVHSSRPLERAIQTIISSTHTSGTVTQICFWSVPGVPERFKRK